MFRSQKIWRRNSGLSLRSLLVLRDAERDVILLTKIRPRKVVITKMLRLPKMVKTRRDRDKERIKEREVAKPRLMTNSNRLRVPQAVKKATTTRERMTSPAEIETETKTTTTIRITLITEISKLPRPRMEILNKETRSLDLDPLVDPTTSLMRKTKTLLTRTTTTTIEIDVLKASKKLMRKISLKIVSSKSNKTTTEAAKETTTRTISSLLKKFTCPNV